eukprot:14710198-Alexandrium_andersonii.AAC.1
MVRAGGRHGPAQAPPRGCRSRSPSDWGTHCKHRNAPSRPLKQGTCTGAALSRTPARHMGTRTPSPARGSLSSAYHCTAQWLRA